MKFNTRATYSLQIALHNFYYPVKSRQVIDPGFRGILIILPLSARHNHVIYLSCVKQWGYQLVENRSHVFLKPIVLGGRTCWDSVVARMCERINESPNITRNYSTPPRDYCFHAKMRHCLYSLPVSKNHPLTGICPDVPPRARFLNFPIH